VGSSDGRWSDVTRVRFFVESDENGRPCLMRGLTRNLLTRTTAEEDVQVLCRDVLSFNLEYYSGTEWVDVWSSAEQENALPAAVRVTLKLNADSDGQDPPSMQRIVPLACAAPAGSVTP